MYSIEVKKS